MQKLNPSFPGRRKLEPFVEGSRLSSSGVKGFTFFVLMRWRVHVFRHRAPKGSRFSSSCAEGFTFFRMSVAQAPEGSSFLTGFRFSPRRAEKKSGVRKVPFPYVVSFKKRHFWSLAAITGFGGPAVPEGSTFQWSVLRAAKKFEPSGEMVSKL